jgi:hypothetical protein
MVQTVPARKIKLHDLKAKFGLERVEDEGEVICWPHLIQIMQG